MNERRELLAAVRARLQRVAAGPDLSPALEPEAIAETRELAGVLAGDEGDLEVRHLLGWLSWYRLQAGADDENRPDLPVVTGLFLPCFLAGAGELPAPLLPVLADQAAGQALIVAMPVTPGLPGQGRLPGVPAEIALLRALLNQPVLLTEPDPGPGAPGDDAAVDEHVPTRASVLARLPAAAIAHFACHGSSDPADPSQSRLLLHDHDAAPLTVASLAPVNLDRAQLAYLYACNTTVTGATELLDEAIHLTSAFQLAGFPHVIGTLWAISDQLAVAIAATFYTHLRTREDTLNTSHAAHALHHAIHVARDRYPATPSLWAAYLHAGT
jgi:hypothetical protein